MRHHTLQEALVYGHGVERPFLCPVHGDSRPSASVNIAKGVWYCYTCGATGGLSGEDLLVEPDYQVLKIWLQNKMEAYRVYPESWLARFTAGGVHPYWSTRVGERAALHFRLGYDPESDRATYPLRGADGGVLGVVRRSTGGSEEASGPKYLYPAGIDVGRLLFNYSPEHRRTIFLVEGALDAIALWRAGVWALAIYGARLSCHQVQLIDRIDPEFIVTAYDMDRAGWRAHYETERAFRHRAVERLSWARSWGKDVDEIGQENLRKALHTLDSPDLWCVGSETCSESPSSTRKSRTTRPWICSSSTSPLSRPRIKLSVT